MTMLLLLKIIFQVMAVGIALLVNLLDYVTRDKRTRLFKKIRLGLFIASGFFLAAGILVVVLDDIDSKNRHKELIVQLERANQPINDVHVDFFVNVPVIHDALKGYRVRLGAGIDEILQTGQLKHDLYVADREPNGRVTGFGIPARSALFPQMRSEPLAYFVFNSVGLHLEFHKGQSEYRPELGEPDLLLRFVAFADVSHEFRNAINQPNTVNVNLRYYEDKSQFTFVASNVHSPSRLWMSNGKILSIPDLLESLLIVRFRGHMLSSHPEVIKYMPEIRRSMSIEHLTLMVNGRSFRLLQSDFKLHFDSDLDPLYAVSTIKIR